MRTRAKKKHAYFQMDWNFDQSTEQFEINLIFRKDFFMDQSYMKKTTSPRTGCENVTSHGDFHVGELSL